MAQRQPSRWVLKIREQGVREQGFWEQEVSKQGFWEQEVREQGFWEQEVREQRLREQEVREQRSGGVDGVALVLSPGHLGCR